MRLKQKKQTIWVLKLPLCIAVFSLCINVSCSDVLVEDISNDSVTLVAPLDSSTFSGNEITFVWKGLDGADTYELMLINSGSIDIYDVGTDSVSNSSIRVTTVLTPGKYQWSVTAYNSEYSSESNVRILVVDTIGDVANATVELIQPLDNVFSNASKVSFSWSPVAIADDYRFDLRKGSVNGELVVSQILSATNFTYTIEENGTYFWGVQANKQFQNSSDFSFNKFSLDTISPNQPQLISPRTDSMVTSFPLSFNWSKSQEFLFSPEHDSLSVWEKIGEDTLLVNRYKISTANSFSLDTIYNGDFIWGVQSFDAANNKSVRSALNLFSVAYE